jgi:hypothetical protein
MKRGDTPVRALLWVLIVTAAGAGCGAKPPYRVFEPPPPTAEELERLGRIKLADSPAGAGGEAASPPPRVWIGIPDRRAEGAALGAAIGAGVGAAIAASTVDDWGQFDVPTETIVATFIGTTVGGAVIGALLGQPGPEAHAAAAKLRGHAAGIDVASLVREGASRSAKLQAYGEGPGAAGPGGTLMIQVVAYGTRSTGGGRACPFVAVRTRLADASTGQVIYDSTSDLRGRERAFHQWSYAEGANFRREIESLARELGTSSVDRALTPRE